PIAVVLVGGPAHVGHLIQAIDNKRRRRAVVGARVQVPGRVVKVTSVFARHHAVGQLQLPDVVVIVRVIAGVSARVPGALTASVVKVFALVKDGVRAVVQVRPGQARNVVVRVGDV